MGKRKTQKSMRIFETFGKNTKKSLRSEEKLSFPLLLLNAKSFFVFMFCVHFGKKI